MVLSAATAFYIGTSAASKVFLGDDLVWPVNIDYKYQYLTTEFLESGTASLVNNGYGAFSVQYSLNNGEWTLLSTTDTGITVSEGDVIRWKQTTTKYASSDSAYISFDFNARCNLYGNMMSLLGGDNFADVTGFTQQRTFVKTFINCKIVDATNFVIGADTVAQDGMRNIFQGNTYMVNGPKILSAMNLGGASYNHMFHGCTSLINAPELPATVLPSNVYNGMFSGCRALQMAPKMATPTSIGGYAYCYMFENCSSLNYVEYYGTSDGKAGWMNSVPSGGTFIKECGVSWPSGASGIPNGWTVKDNCPPVPTGGTKYRITSVANATFSDGDKIVLIEPNNKKIITGIGRSSTSFSAFTGEGVYDELPAGAAILVYYSSHLTFEDGTCANSEAVLQSSYSSIARFIANCSVDTKTVGLLTSGNYKGRLLTSVPQYGNIGLYLVDATSGYNYPHFQYATTTSTSPFFLGYKLTEEAE